MLGGEGDHRSWWAFWTQRYPLCWHCIPGLFFDINPKNRRDLSHSPCHHFIRYKVKYISFNLVVSRLVPLLKNWSEDLMELSVCSPNMVCIQPRSDHDSILPSSLLSPKIKNIGGISIFSHAISCVLSQMHFSVILVPSTEDHPKSRWDTSPIPSKWWLWLDVYKIRKFWLAEIVIYRRSLKNHIKRSQIHQKHAQANPS